MTRIAPLQFQNEHIEALLARFEDLRGQYDLLAEHPDPAQLKFLRQTSACVLLQAPTGIGKTLMACELMSSFDDDVLWLWFAPFAGIIGQAERTLRRQAPALVQLDIETDRRAERLQAHSVFVLTWQTVAARSRDSRIARTSGDEGLAIDDLVLLARERGLRIGVVVDEAHHGFVKATEACRFFANVLEPDYVLLMTATPRDQDADRFATATGYRIGGPAEWASVSRAEGVDAGLLKRSVKAARFIVRNEDDAALLSFEEVAMAECATMHRQLKATLASHGVGLTPLMLVQVPNGGAALERAREYLVKTLKFPESAVRVHTASEPDPNLEALADDPQVEVIVFKMAIATGFDAPRAFTLAALRGTRDVNFGIQVVGRIMRVHRLLQGRTDLPRELFYGYVFLANSEAQEGLLGAASRINEMPEHLASAQASTVVTVIAGESSVQVTRPGEPLALFPSKEAAREPGASGFTPSPSLGSTQAGQGAFAQPFAGQSTLFAGISSSPAHSADFAQGDSPADTPLRQALALDTQVAARRYPRKPGVPAELVTEMLPQAPEDFEEQLVAHIDFRPVLGDRLRVQSQLTERSVDIFEASGVEDRDIWARYSSVAIAQKARQLAFEFEDVDRREFLKKLKERFRDTLRTQGYELPETDEELTRQLELVLVRNPQLVRNAYKRVQADQVKMARVALRDTLESEWALAPALKNAYGVFPDDLSPSEREFAERLDTAGEVLWWHRNPSRKPESVGLYGWSNGKGFFPDFVVAVDGRKQGEGLALTELKGPQIRHYDRLKAGAEHPVYGRVYMVGCEPGSLELRLWRMSADELVDDGPFEAKRLRYA